MRGLGKVVSVLTAISGLLNAVVFIGTVVSLLKQYVGFLAYFLWVFVAPILSPAFLGLPWFEAWVKGTEVSERLFWLWVSFFVCLALRIALWKWAPENVDE